MSLAPAFHAPHFVDADVPTPGRPVASTYGRFPVHAPLVKDTVCAPVSGQADRYQTFRYLDEVRDDLGHIPSATLSEAATALGLSEEYTSKVYRRYRIEGHVARRPGSTKKIELPNEYKAQVTVFQYAGDVKKAHQRLTKTGDIPPMAYKTFLRRVNAWDPAILACARGGTAAMVRHQFFNIEHIPHKGYVYGSDHTKLPIQVIPPRGTKPVWPWLTTLIDFYSRVVLGFKLTLHTPTADDNLDVFLEGIDGWETEEGVFVGGKPNFIRTDRGGDYISTLLSKNLMDLDIGRQFTAPYASWMNGITERVNGRIDKSFAPTVYGFHPGGQEAKTRRTLQVPLSIESLNSLEMLDRRLADWFVEYNHTPHRSLGGLTPLEAWADDPHLTERADTETLVNAMNIRGTRTLHKYGIEIRGRKYTSPDLARLRQAGVKQVQVAYHEHQEDTIEVFKDGVWEGTATRGGFQTETYRLGVLAIRRQQRAQVIHLIKKADYEKVVAERERMLLEGEPESKWPTLPEDPDAEDAKTEAADLDDQVPLPAEVEKVLDDAATTATDWENTVEKRAASGAFTGDLPPVPDAGDAFLDVAFGSPSSTEPRESGAA